MKIIRNIIIGLVMLCLLFFVLLYVTTFHPGKVESMEVINGRYAPELKTDRNIKVLCWNVQYMAGKNYFFWYDIIDNSGPDIKPSREDIVKTRHEVVRIIKDEDPDLIIIQEIHDNAKRTGYEDQLTALLELLPDEYSCYTSAYYWKASFVPIKQIMGSVGMKLVTISKYKLNSARRYQLPVMPLNPLFQQFNFKRAILETRIALEDGKEFALLNTHLDAFAQNNDTMEQQVKMVKSILTGLDREDTPWVIGGDFNLLPNKMAYNQLSGESRTYYNPETELNLLTADFNVIPSIEDVSGEHRSRWFTYYPNNPAYEGPIKTIDYMFYSDLLEAGKYQVRSKDTLKISDHLPIISEFRIKR